MTRVLIFGQGFLGTRLRDELDGAELVPTDITDRAAVREVLRERRPAAVINAAGTTGRPNVDYCETHQEQTYRSNVVGPLVLAEECAALGPYLLHLGSGCVFYGPSPSPGGWREDDPANPVSFYSRTKYAADLVLSRLPNVGIARLRMPVDERPGPRNLITKLASYDRVSDVENSMTFVPDFVRVAERLVTLRATGVFHVTNPGPLRHRDIVEAYQAVVDAQHRCTFIPDAGLLELGLVSARRSNCILASPRLAALGIHMRPAREALEQTMMAYAAAAAAAKNEAR